MEEQIWSSGQHHRLDTMEMTAEAGLTEIPLTTEESGHVIMASVTPVRSDDVRGPTEWVRTDRPVEPAPPTCVDIKVEFSRRFRVDAEGSRCSENL